MDYQNILNAINKPQGADPSADLARRTENYRMAEQLNQEGMSIKDLLTKVDELTRKVESMEKPSRSMDEDLFLVMEAAVRDDESVVKAKERMAVERARVISELCSRDPGYADARDAYRGAVYRAYVERRGDVAGDSA